MVVCLPGWAYMMSYKLAYAPVISCRVGWELGGLAKPGLRCTGLFRMVPLFISRLVRIYLPGNGRVQKPNGSLQGLLSLGLQRAHHMFVILYWSKQIIRQAETEVLGKWTSSWKGPAKSWCKEHEFREEE